MAYAYPSSGSGTETGAGAGAAHAHGMPGQTLAAMSAGIGGSGGGSGGGAGGGVGGVGVGEGEGAQAAGAGAGAGAAAGAGPTGSGMVGHNQIHGHGHLGLNLPHGLSVPGRTIGGMGMGMGMGGRTSRKSSDERGDVLRDFMTKIQEDENYIDFFQERIRIEETYVAQLQKLYDRAVAKDSLHDDQQPRLPRSTARRAWAEVRDHTSREIDAKHALAQALRAAILPELVKTRDEQERIRLGLKDNIRSANEMYDDHVKHQLPKLKKAYWTKCQMLEDHKRQESAIAAQARLLSSPQSSSPSGTPAHEFPNPHAHQYTSPPTSNAPLPASSNPAMERGGGAINDAYFSPPAALGHLAPPERERAGGPGRASISGPGPGPGPGFGLAGGMGGGGGVTSPGAASGTGGRLRAGSASAAGEKKDPKDVFQDLAVQGKKGFNAIMQKLGGDKDRDKDRDRGGESEGFVMIGASGREEDGSGGGGGGMGMGMGMPGLQRRGTGTGRGQGKGGETAALRAVRIKREADEADKQYRAGVFHLESLRLRRDKVYASAITNLEQFNDDLTIKLRNALSTYVDIVHATAATNVQATEVVRQVVDQVDAGRDMMLFRTRLMAVRSVQSVPIPYENFYVGTCRSLIFGVSLSDYDFARGEGGDHGRPPAIVEKCIAAVDAKGIELEGLYRISGRKAAVEKMIQDIELDEERFAFDDKDDVHAIASVLKQYLRELREPVFSLPHAERIKYTENREFHINSNFSALRSRLRRLPPIHQTTFQAIIEHLGRVQSRSAVNKMNAKNIAVIFMVFGPDLVTTDMDPLTMHRGRDSVLEDLITYADLLFSSEQDVSPQSSAPFGRYGITAEYGVVDGANLGSSRTRLTMTDQGAGTGAVGAALLGVGDAVAGISNRRGAGTDPDLLEMPQWSMYTPDDELELLFSPGLIPASFRESIGEGLHVRPLSSTDLMRSHFPLLADLSTAPAIAPSTYAALFKHLASCPATYYIVVVVDMADDQLVAAATLIVERKHLHGGGAAGHVEDVVVSHRAQGRGLGAKMMQGMKELGEGLGCYKVILDCQEGKVGFYEKCGFKRRGVQMAYYVGDNDKSASAAPSIPPPSVARQGSGSALTPSGARAGGPDYRDKGKGKQREVSASSSLAVPFGSSGGHGHVRGQGSGDYAGAGAGVIDLASSIASDESHRETVDSGSTASKFTYSVPAHTFVQQPLSPTRGHGLAQAQAQTQARAGHGETPPRALAGLREVAAATMSGTGTGSGSGSGSVASPGPDDVVRSLPAWADAGLGSAELSPKRDRAARQGSLGSLRGDAGTQGLSAPPLSLGLANESQSGGSGARPYSPLPPGAAPPVLDAEPERVAGVQRGDQ